MPSLLKFLVPLAIFLSGSYAHAFTSLSPVAGNQARANHLIRFEEPMSNPTNEPSREPIREPTNDQMINDQTTIPRLEWDAELPNILSPKRGKYSLSQKQDAELPSKITILTTQFTSNISYKFEKVNGINTSYTFEAVNGVNAKPFETVNGVSNVHDKYIVVNHDHDKSIVNKRVTFSDERDSEILSESPFECNSRSNDSNGLRRSAERAVSSRRKVSFHSRISFKQIKRSSTHAYLVLFSSFYAIGTELKCGVHPHWVVAKSSSKRVGNIAFTQPQSAKAALKATAEMQASADSNKMPSIFQLIPGNETKAESKNREPETEPKAESKSREPETDPKAESKSREPENEPKAKSKSREPGNETKAESKS